ncbi:aspartate-semialdehyde dehydrogenase [Desulfosarcina ovata subsp. sediminis]|uniref:Aspartate-semialdehyde dehydrogenase n=1 Tax=Desulfosarcina ovata subsp. sediminis TaxID=885957 RepID=A0A5K7ZWZ1_9BACT|nr:aspartate-semialdehyde dehydrogenase [Desulfosarcina ovata]BBO84773.1 aspartate-semialdehyde dehydrogenase [Desulfosarcina ovata subsp. sediminis]
MVSVGIVGWRGMVGSVLMDRMVAENDFGGFEPVFFSTSQAGKTGPDIGTGPQPVLDANDVEKLAEMDVVVSCQGGSYTERIHPALRQRGWLGYWIDAASTLRMTDDSMIVLDPVNRGVIDKALESGTKDYIGGNCTVSLMLMAVGGLFEKNWIEWITSMTYQSASGAGANNMRELVAQMGCLGDSAKALLADPAASILDIDRQISATLADPDFPTQYFGAPLAASLIPWIDRAMENGQTREEWKGVAETNKILGRSQNPIPIDGQCVRVGAMRCHSQALTIKLTEDLPLNVIEDAIVSANDWVTVIPNDKATTLSGLSPAAVSGTLGVPVGRVRKLILGPDYLTVFTVGDQLLWGAAEPLRRALRIILDYLGSVS